MPTHDTPPPVPTSTPGPTVPFVSGKWTTRAPKKPSGLKAFLGKIVSQIGIAIGEAKFGG